MSLILDALRKMEQEPKSRRGSTTDLRPEVLRYRAEARPQQNKPYLLFVAGALLIAAGVAATLYLKGSHLPLKTASPAAAQMPAPVPDPVTVPQVAPQPAPAVAVPAPAPRLPQAPPASAPPVQAAQAQPQSPPAAPPASKARKPAAAPSEPAPGTVSQESPSSIPDLTISGIAWQEERRLRRAVVNGTLVAEGAEVAGARVVEIKETKVRFSRGGQIFDVLFSSGSH